MDFKPLEALQQKYGPLPGYAWLGIIAIVGFFVIRMRAEKAGTLADGGGEDSGEFSSSVRTTDGEGNETEYSASGPNSGFLGAVQQFVAGPMPSSAGDIYVNLPGGASTGKTLQTYKVGEGEDLHSIARKVFGDDKYWRALWRQNLELIGEDPWKDLKGLVLQIPDGYADALESSSGGTQQPAAPPKYADTDKHARSKIYDAHKGNPHGLADILEKWSKENEHKNKSLSVQQKDWAKKLRSGK